MKTYKLLNKVKFRTVSKVTLLMGTLDIKKKFFEPR